MRRGDSQVGWLWPGACFVACIPSGASLLGKVYGLAPMHLSTLFLVLPGTVFVLVVWLVSRARKPALAETISVGAWGGLVGTLGYDLVRVPVHLAGRLVFSPIASYGVLIANADHSSRFTDAQGWLYHFTNGISFGVMYALVARGRHWGWAVLWAMILESLAVFSPFGWIYGLIGNREALAIAYAAHFAYGLPLGLIVERWGPSSPATPAANRWTALCVLSCLAMAAMIAAPLAWPEAVARDGQAKPGHFSVDDRRLTPDWVRVERGTDVAFVNGEDSAVQVRFPQSGRTLVIAPGQSVVEPVSTPGIFQVYVVQPRRTRSSFLMVEPIEETPRASGDSSYHLRAK